MTQIIYTITLVNSDRNKASASTLTLEYPDTPSSQLRRNAEQTVEDLAKSHIAMTTMIKEAMQNNGTIQVPDQQVWPASKSRAVGKR